jgi:hypothetical protein
LSHHPITFTNVGNKKIKKCVTTVFSRAQVKQRGQVFILDNRIGNNGLSEPQNAQDAKLLAPVIFMFDGKSELKSVILWWT